MDPLHRLLDLERFGIKLGLDPIHRLTAALGHPERAWPSVHIAGTNGKGSVAAMIDAALRAAGHTTGRYTSPHLDRLEERFAINDVPVETAALMRATADVLATIEQLLADGGLEAWPSFFEATTAIAFLLFTRAGIDAGVIEVGLGGRFDATTVLRPSVTAITSIDLDHQRHLGNTRAQIAFEKAGIAKRGVPLVVGPCDAEATAVIADAAAAVDAPVIEAMAGVRCEVSYDHGRATLDLTTPTRAYPPITLGLAGRHQVANAVVAVRALECFAGATPLPLPPAAIVEGLSRVRWPARLEWIALPGGRRVLLDAAHNPAGAAALAAYLEDAGLGAIPIVVAVMADKDTAGIIRPVAGHARPLVATEAPTPRTSRAAAVAEVAARLGVPEVVTEPDPDRALARALDAGDQVVVMGSIFLVGPLGARLRAGGRSS